jgi:hypothetical protein
VSEKLAAFVTLYSEKAASDVEDAKTSLVKAEEKLSRATELWNSIKAEAEKLGIVDKFISAFPEPGGGVIAIIGGTTPNPDYMTLFDYGDPLESSVKELTKLKNATRRLNNAKNSLEFAESLLARKPEDHANILGSAVAQMVAKSSSLGAGKPDVLFKAIFEDYEEFKDVMMSNLEGAEGPSHVNTSQQAFDLLKDRLESGAIAKKQEETTAPVEGAGADAAKAAIEEAAASPINEQEELKAPDEIASGSASPINVPESPVIEETATPEVAGSSPGLNQPKESEQSALVANINIEQTEPAKPAESTPASPVSPTPETAPQPAASEPAAPETTVATSSTFMNMDFSKMSAEAIANSFLTGDVFGETKNEFSNVFGGKTVSESPVNQPAEKSTAEASEPGKSEEGSPPSETTETSPASTFMNMDFSKMSAKEIANSFLTGDVFGETKNEFSNVFGGEGIFKSKEEKSSSESVENKKDSPGNIFSKGRERGSKETVERGSAKMSTPAVAPPPSTSTSQETSMSNVTNQSVENQTSGSVNNQTSTVSNVSNDNSDQSMSESMSSNRSSMMQSAGSDNSDIVARLKRLERLLSGPLEVKIVES